MTTKGGLVRGFTLIELMVTVVVLSILSTLAVTSYRGYLLRANRGEAAAALLRLRVAQERFFLQNNRYASNAEMTAASPAGLGLPATTERGNYQITIVVGAPPITYTATAAAVSGYGQYNDNDCRSFTVNETGTRTAISAASADTSAMCWR